MHCLRRQAPSGRSQNFLEFDCSLTAIVNIQQLAIDSGRFPRDYVSIVLGNVTRLDVIILIA